MAETAHGATAKVARLFGEWPVYLLLAAIALVFAINVEVEKHNALQRALLDQRERGLTETRQVAARVERYFDQIYRGLRTIARLPSVRTIDRHAENFHLFARASVQEIYNNLAETARISEVYILPIDFDPDAIDPATGKPQEPIAMFDELIIGRSADRKTAERSATPSGAAVLEEIEIYEYRLMMRQIALLKSRYEVDSAIKELAYPAVLGSEVVTCDNTFYSASHPDDAARKGLVFSIPFYDLDGRMRGIVSAVMLTSTIRQLLPPGDYLLANSYYDLKIDHPGSSSVLPEQRPVLAQSTSAESINTLPLSLRDITDGWTLSSFTSQASYEASSDVMASKDKAFHRHLAILISFAAMFSIVRLSAQRHREVQAQNALLEARVHERTEALEAARETAEAASFAKTQFLAHMSHEIRTPMSAVIGTVDLLMRSETDAPKAQHLRVIRSSGQALIDLINQMLDLAAVETGRVALSPAQHQLRTLITEVAQLFEARAQGKGLHLTTNVTSGVPESVWIDAGCCRQVLINLVANAISATDTGGVSIHVDVVEGAGGPSLYFEVADTGRGIPVADGGSIFELKGTRRSSPIERKGGSGLGLPISRMLVEKMGGSIDFRLQPTGGTAFFFSLPLYVVGGA
ncbi:MAG: ATP-binding protein, partial [Hyphomicrobiaceae bacterium]